jgi:DNA polymerase III epsilon subunit-like protein
MYLFFDTETNGLPKDWKAPADQFDNWPRIIQLAYAVFDEKEQLIVKSCNLIKPDGWEIPKLKFWIDNGYSTEKNMEQGIPLRHALSSFVSHRTLSDYSIAHNMAFDSKIIRAEMIRMGLDMKFDSKKICTMNESTNFCQLPGARGFKWPKLEELHRKLFGCDFTGAHDAMADVLATAKCFFELKKLNVIKL